MSYRYGTPVKELQKQISSRDFAELWAEEQLEPRGPARQELQFARLMCLIANIHRDPKRSAFRWQDFIAEFSPAERSMDAEQMDTLLRAFAASFGSKNGNNRQSSN